jgi:hypothetical protein
METIPKTKKYTHDCNNCRFLGHYFDHDVYLCGESVIARYGNEPEEYASGHIKTFFRVLRTNERTGWKNEQGEQVSASWQEYFIQFAGKQKWMLACLCAFANDWVNKVIYKSDINKYEIIYNCSNNHCWSILSSERLGEGFCPYCGEKSVEVFFNQICFE